MTRKQAASEDHGPVPAVGLGPSMACGATFSRWHGGDRTWGVRAVELRARPRPGPGVPGLHRPARQERGGRHRAGASDVVEVGRQPASANCGARTGRTRSHAKRRNARGLPGAHTASPGPQAGTATAMPRRQELTGQGGARLRHQGSKLHTTPLCRRSQGTNLHAWRCRRVHQGANLPQRFTELGSRAPIT